MCFGHLYIDLLLRWLEKNHKNIPTIHGGEKWWFSMGSNLQKITWKNKSKFTYLKTDIQDTSTFYNTVRIRPRFQPPQRRFRPGKDQETKLEVAQQGKSLGGENKHGATWYVPWKVGNTCASWGCYWKILLFGRSSGFILWAEAGFLNHQQYVGIFPTGVCLRWFFADSRMVNQMLSTKKFGEYVSTTIWGIFG